VTATALASDLSISRQAVSKHLGVLHDAGLTTSQRVGRETRYAADFAALAAVQEWVTRVENSWSARLSLLVESVESAPTD